MIDRYQLSHYRVVAERDFLKFGATEFQGWFGRVMAAAFISDYINVRISKGDGGIDGYRLSTVTVYQVYEPRVGSDSATTAKIRENSATAQATLKEYELEMKGLVFVPNDPHDSCFDDRGFARKENPAVGAHSMSQ